LYKETKVDLQEIILEDASRQNGSKSLKYKKGDYMTKLCPRGKAAAKRKFKVYPSAYANAYASKICAGKIKDPSGVKRKDFKGKKPSRSKVASAAKRVRKASQGLFMNEPTTSGSPIKINIDDQEFSNPSTVNYYKGMGIT